MNQQAEPNRMFTVTSIDLMFGALPSHEGSFLTLDDAIRCAEQSKQRCPSRHTFEILDNPLGLGYTDSPVVVSLIGTLGPRTR